MKKILYLTHVSWAIIKQRPQFIAEELSKYCQVDVYYKRTYKTPKKDLKTKLETNERMSLRSYQILPFDKISFFNHINVDWINRIWMKMQMPNFDDYDYVWISSPYTFRFIKNIVNDRTKLIYDCMDDHLAFPDAPLVSRGHMLEDEKTILEKAYKVFCTSNYLKDTILERAGIQREVIISHNGIKIPQQIDVTSIPEDISKILTLIKSKPLSLLYIGAISEWFDFGLILKALDEDEDMNVFLVGPVKTKIPEHKRLHVLGTVERTYIFELMKVSSALTMPFVVNDLIKSVNPVKLYEYIYSGKPVISVRYAETEYFKEFVHLYNGLDEFQDVIRTLRRGDDKAFDSTERNIKIRKFIESNTWEYRTKDISELLEL